MSGFLNKASLLLFTALVAPAYAQVPHTLVPPPRDDQAIVSDTHPDDSADRDSPRITAAPIAAPSIQGFGTFEATGNMADLWTGVSLDTAETLLGYFRVGIADPVLRDLTVRALTAQATPPQGAASPDAPLQGAGPNWLDDRVQALIAIGEGDKAASLLDSIPASMITPSLRKTQAELTLLRGDTDNACRLAGSADEDVFWKKFAIFCDAVHGKGDQAMVGVDLLRESSPKDADLFFQEAIRRLGDPKSDVKNLPRQWSLFDVALLQAAHATDRIKDRIDQIPPPALLAISNDKDTDPKLREKANLRAQQTAMTPVPDSNKLPEPAFTKSLASDVSTLVASLESGAAPNAADNDVIARLAIGDGAAVQDTRRVQRLLTLMEPFGYHVPPAVWRTLLARKIRYDGDVPPAMLLARLDQASEAGHKGEVILLSGLILGSTETEHASELALRPVIVALKRAGFGVEARRIAASAVHRYR